MTDAATAAAAAGPPARTDLVAALRRRVQGTFEIDPWGLDPDLVRAVDVALDLRWSTEISGVEHLPAEGPAVLVASRRVGVSEPLVLSRAVRRASGRTVRFLGIPDIAPLGPALRRLGGAVDHPAEQAALVRAGEMVGVFLGPVPATRHRAGPLAPDALAPALGHRVPVLPVAVIGSELRRHWRVIVGEPVPAPTGRGPLAKAELAEAARAGVQELLDEAFPPRWLLH